MIRRAWWLIVTGALTVGGCVHTERTTPAASLPTSVALPGPTEHVVLGPAERVVSYPEGRYELHGDGAALPFYWVWIPVGNAPPPLKSQ